MDLKTFHFFPSCFEIGNWVCHILFFYYTKHTVNVTITLLWYDMKGLQSGHNSRKKVKVTKSQKASSIMSLLENIDWNQSVSIFFFCLQYVLLKPNYFKKHHFYLPKVIIQVQNSNGVLNRLVRSLKWTELACWVLQASLDLYYYLR